MKKICGYILSASLFAFIIAGIALFVINPNTPTPIVKVLIVAFGVFVLASIAFHSLSENAENGTKDSLDEGT